MLSTRMLPPLAVAVPISFMYSRMGLFDRRFGLIMLYTCFNLSFTTWMMKAFIDEIPAAYEEAAILDGHSRLEALWHVVLPQAAPGLAATAVPWGPLAAAALGLSDKLYRNRGELSGGEMQRVAIGRALVRRPKLFLMDEPLASLDAKLRERMVSEIRRLQRSLGCGMLYVTHDHVEAMSLADRILVLDHGKIPLSGPPEEIYRCPVESRVARMLGRPGINLLTHDEAGRMGLPLSGKGLVGVRPESWRVTADPSGPTVAEVVEHFGSQVALVLDLQGIVLRATVPPALRAKAGDRFRLGVYPGRLVHPEC